MIALIVCVYFVCVSDQESKYIIMKDFQTLKRISSRSRLYSRYITFTVMFSFYSIIQRYPLAYNDFKDSLHLQPRQSYALHYQALCLYHMRKFQQAIKIFKAVLQLDPSNFDIMQSLAQAYM